MRLRLSLLDGLYGRGILGFTLLDWLTVLVVALVVVMSVIAAPAVP